MGGGGFFGISLGVEASSLPEVRDVTPSELDALIESSGELLVIYMWGPDCPNCVIFKRHLPGMLEQLAGASLRIAKLDVYEYPEVARRYGVFGIPHFLLFKGGKRLGKMSEFRGDSFWLSVIREHL